MATYSISKGHYIRPARAVRTRTFPEAPSQTFKVGAPLILNTTTDKGNQVAAAAADPDGTVVGFAAKDASGVEGTDIQVWMLDAEAEFHAVIGDTQTLDNDDIGNEFGLVSDGTNVIWRVDRTETSTVVVRVVAFGPKPDGTSGNCVHGDVNAAVIVRAASGKQGLLKP